VNTKVQVLKALRLKQMDTVVYRACLQVSR